MLAIKKSKVLEKNKESLKDIIDAVAAKEDALRPTTTELKKKQAVAEYEVGIDSPQIPENTRKANAEKTSFKANFFRGLAQGAGFLIGLTVMGVLLMLFIGWLVTLPYFGDYLYNFLILIRSLAAARF